MQNYRLIHFLHTLLFIRIQDFLKPLYAFWHFPQIVHQKIGDLESSSKFHKASGYISRNDSGHFYLPHTHKLHTLFHPADERPFPHIPGSLYTMIQNRSISHNQIHIRLIWSAPFFHIVITFHTSIFLSQYCKSNF